MQGHLSEARAWLNRMFAVNPIPPPPLLILALRGLRATTHLRGDYGLAIASLDEELGICRELRDD
jgi:tetratricopeptide (TPR) repeat protein